MRLNGLVRTGAKLIKGLEIHLTAQEFELTVISVIGWFKIVERYQLSGAVTCTRRRDRRRGRWDDTARVSLCNQW
jgi:hypothetical protein